MDIRDILAANVKMAREQAGITQAGVAAAIGLPSRSAVSEMESGKRRVSAAELAKLAQLFGRQIDWFFDPVANQEDFVSLARAQDLSPAAREALREVQRVFANYILLRVLLQKG